MEYGSERIWVYDKSDDEYVSEAELEEGMWLSDSEGEDTITSLPKTKGAGAGPPPPPPPLSSPPPPPPPPPQEDLEGSTTKYLPPLDSDEETDDEAEEEEVKEKVGGAASKANGRGSSGGGAGLGEDKAVEYTEVALGGAVGGVKSKSKKVHYAKIAPPKVRISAASAPLPPPPPPPPAPPQATAPQQKGIKNRLNDQRLRKFKRARRVPSPQPRQGRGRMVRRTDTNILAVKFNKLIEPSDVHTGDPVVCQNQSCLSVLSHLSSITDQEGKDEKLWLCEFCGEQNEVDVVREEIPTKADTTFLISPAPVAVEGGAGGGGAKVEEALVVFCIDISGSMCVTTEVPGKFELKGHDRVKDLSSLNVHNEDQYLPRQRRDVTYVSRLQSVQAAVDQQLTELASSNPSQRVALVTFSDEVTLVGDGCGDTLTMAGDKLWNSDAIVKIGSDAQLPAAISTSSKALSKKVFQLEESGQTALGPALLVSISLASRVSGSKVIICTDGLANKGVGNLDGMVTPEEKAAAQTFYEDMGTIALDKNVTVSLVRIKGTDCKALELGQVADKTGGEVTTVDPLNITQEFASILANPIIATNVKTRIVLHGQLYFRTEETKESALVIPVGNVTAETELTYEYGARSRPKSTKKTPSASAGASPAAPSPKGASASAEVPSLMLEGKPHLPFQLQIEYTGRDGSHCLRVISEARPTTHDRIEAERNIHMGVVGSHVAHKTAQLAMEGEYTSSRITALSSQRLLQRSSHASSEHRLQYNALMEDIIPLEQELKTKQQSERATFGRQYSDNEAEEEEFYRKESELMDTPLATPQNQQDPSPRKAAPKKKKAISRRQDISDDLATYCYNMKKQQYQ